MLNYGLFPTGLLALLLTGCCTGGYGRTGYSPVGQTAMTGRAVSYADPGSSFMRPGTTVRSPVVIHNAAPTVAYQNGAVVGNTIAGNAILQPTASSLPYSTAQVPPYPSQIVNNPYPSGQIVSGPVSTLPLDNAPLINPPLVTGQYLPNGVVNGPVVNRPLLNRRMANGPIVNGPIVMQPQGVIATSPVVLAPVTATANAGTLPIENRSMQPAAAEPAQPLPASQKSTTAEQQKNPASASAAAPATGSHAESQPFADSINAVPNHAATAADVAAIAATPEAAQDDGMPIPSLNTQPQPSTFSDMGSEIPASLNQSENDIPSEPIIETMSHEERVEKSSESRLSLAQPETSLNSAPAQSSAGAGASGAQLVTAADVSDVSLAWYPWPFSKSPVSTLTADRISDSKTLISNRATLRPQSIAAEVATGRLQNNKTLNPQQLQGTPSQQAGAGVTGLNQFGARTLKDLAYVNLYIGGDAAWKAYEIEKIDETIQLVMADPAINAEVKKAFGNQSLRNVRLPSHPLKGAFGDHISRADIHHTLTILHENGYLEDYDLDHTVFNLLLPAGTVLMDDSVEMNSIDGLAGYHGSINSGYDSVLYTAVVYSEKNDEGMENGICAFESSWKNVVAVLHHQMQKTRTNPDAEEVLRLMDDPNSIRRLAWVSKMGLEIGDETLLGSQNVNDSFREVRLSDGSGVVPAFLFQSSTQNLAPQSSGADSDSTTFETPRQAPVQSPVQAPVQAAESPFNPFSGE